MILETTKVILETTKVKLETTKEILGIFRIPRIPGNRRIPRIPRNPKIPIHHGVILGSSWGHFQVIMGSCKISQEEHVKFPVKHM